MNKAQAEARFIYGLDEPVKIKQKVSEREYKVLRLREEGKTMAEIGASLHISPGSVWNCVEQLRKKNYEI